MALAQKYNPLRSIKPMRDDWEEQLRVSSMVAPAPKLPNTVMKSNIKVGVFDGGVQSGTKLLDPYVDNYDMVSAEPTETSLNHGANVCGAVLYGTGLAGKMEMIRWIIRWFPLNHSECFQQQKLIIRKLTIRCTQRLILLKRL